MSKRWTEVQNLPKDLGVKVDMGKLKGFDGICDLTLTLTRNDVYFKEMKIEFPTPWIYEYKNQSKGVPEPFMPEELEPVYP